MIRAPPSPTYHPHLQQQITQWYLSVLQSPTVIAPVFIYHSDNTAAFAIYYGQSGEELRVPAPIRGHSHAVNTGGPKFQHIQGILNCFADRQS